MPGQNFSKFLDKEKKYWKRLPKSLGIIGGITILLIFLLDSLGIISDYSWKYIDTPEEFVGVFIFYIFPILLGLIGGIKAGTRFFGGILMYIGGLIIFIDWALSGYNFLCIPSFMLMTGGLLAVKSLWLRVGLIILFLLLFMGLMSLLAT